MGHVIINIFIAIIGLWITITPIVWIYWTFRPKERPSQLGAGWQYAFFLGALFGLATLFEGGFYGALFFIPSTWGGINDDGDYVKMRYSLAILLAVVLSWSVLFLLGKLESLIEENKELHRKIKSMRDEGKNRFSVDT
jgi:hypothetical protein